MGANQVIKVEATRLGGLVGPFADTLQQRFLEATGGSRTCQPTEAGGAGRRAGQLFKDGWQLDAFETGETENLRRNRKRRALGKKEKDSEEELFQT